MSNVRRIFAVILIFTLLGLGVSVAFTIMDLRQSTLDVRMAKDDIAWPIQQIEVEINQLLTLTLENRIAPVALPELDLRYAILLSRTDLFKRGEFSQEIAELPESAVILQQVTDAVESLATEVDQSIKGDTGAMERLASQLKSVRDLSHQLTLQINNDKIHNVVQRRERLSTVFRYTEILLAVLAITASLGFVFLYLMIKKAEQNRSEAEFHRRRAEASNEAKSRFLSNMSHELRTPLNAIMGFAQLIRMDTDKLDREQASQIDEIYTASNHLLSLINDILDLSRIESGRLGISLEPCSVDQVIRECFQLVNRQAEDRQITLHFPCSRNDFLLEADRTRLKQVMTNLLTNAVKYNRNGGWVKVELQPRERTNRLKIEVIDNGLGIREEDQKKVFKPFERFADDVTIEGTGIGLALCQQLVLFMGGDIGFRSVPGEGSRFWIELPYTEVLPPATAYQEDDTRVSGFGSRLLLSIDDNPGNQALLKSYLERIPDLQLITCQSAQQALQELTAQQPDLILLDYHLGNQTGTDLIGLIRSRLQNPQTPLILLSAATDLDPGNGQPAGCAETLTKPLTFEKLISLLERQFRNRHASQTAQNPS